MIRHTIDFCVGDLRQVGEVKDSGKNQQFLLFQKTPLWYFLQQIRETMCH